MYVQWAWFSRE